MRNLFIVTSALNSYRGCISSEDRFIQTINCLENLKNKLQFSDDIILFTDGSPDKVSEYQIEEIKKFVHTIVLFNEDVDVNRFAKLGNASLAESVMMFKLLKILKEKSEFRDFFADLKRIYKYSCRSLLLEKFNTNDYDEMRGKYCFKKAIPSWMNTHKKMKTTDHLYITRLFSFCISLYEDYSENLHDIIQAISKFDIDTEHAHHLCINKKNVFELENLYCEGIVSISGEKETY